MSIQDYLGKASLWLFFSQFLTKIKLIRHIMYSIAVAPFARGFLMNPYTQTEQGPSRISASACSISVCCGNDPESS